MLRNPRRLSPLQLHEKLSLIASLLLGGGGLSLLGGRSHHVQSASGLEPLPLSGVDGRGGKELLLGSILVGDLNLNVLSGLELVQAEDGDLVGTRDLVVVGGVLEPEGEHTLLLQVGLVDTGERSADDSSATQESGLKSGVLSGRSLSVVLVTNNDPGDTGVSVLGSDSGDGTELAGNLVEDLVGLTVVGVDGTDQAVLGNVLQVSSVLEPRSTSRDVVGGALALGLDKDRSLNDVLSVPRLEGLEELESVRGGADGDRDGGSVGRRSLEGVLSGVVTLGRELEASGLRELELLAVGALEGVGQGVEGEVTGEDHGGDKVRGSDEGVGGGVGIVSSSEVSVVRRDDRVDLALLDVLSVPLADAGSTSVGKDDTSDVLEGLDHTVTSNGGSDLLRSGGDGESGLGLESVVSGLLGNVGGSGHVLVRGVGAGTDKSDFELLGPRVLLDLGGELGDGGGKIGGEGTVDVGLKLGEVDLDSLVVLGSLVGSQVVGELLGVSGLGGSSGGLEVGSHSLVEGEERGGSTNLGTHVTDGSHTSAREGLDSGTVVLDDGTGSTLDSKDTGDLEDDVLGGSPSAHLSVEVDTNDLGGLQLPRNTGHDVDSVGSSDTTGDHTETSSVRSVRVGSDHHETRESVVLEDDLVDDTGSRLPETNTVLGTGSGKEVVDLLVDVDSSGKILDTSNLGLDQVITVDGSGDGGLGKTSGHELEDGHLSGGILASNSLRESAVSRFSPVSAKGNLRRVGA
jgi:hypothetical protein